MSAVKTVTEKINSKGDKNAILRMEDGRDIWTPEYDKALPLLGKPIPADWYQDEGQYGPRAFPPRAKGSGGGGGGSKMASWYNSEAGVRYTQDQMNIRTALMQATEVMKDYVSRGTIESFSEGAIDPFAGVHDLTAVADIMYEWLRKTSPAAVGEGSEVKKPTAGSSDTAVATGPVGANAGVSSPSSTPTGSTSYPADWPQEGR